MLGRLWQLRPRGHMAGTLRAALVLVVLLVIYAILQPSLLKVTQITNVVNEASVVGLAAVGETIVVLAGGFDLCIASLNVIAIGGGRSPRPNCRSGSHAGYSPILV